MEHKKKERKYKQMFVLELSIKTRDIKLCVRNLTDIYDGAKTC